eukprot:6256330-Pyramimonas_sp.AAC.1
MYVQGFVEKGDAGSRGRASSEDKMRLVYKDHIASDMLPARISASSWLSVPGARTFTSSVTTFRTRRHSCSPCTVS